MRHRLLFAFSLALVAAQLAAPVAHAGGQTGSVAPTGFFVVGDLSARRDGPQVAQSLLIDIGNGSGV